MNLEGLGGINGKAPALLRWDKAISQGFYPSLTKSGSTYTFREAYDAGWVDGDQELIDPIPVGMTQLDVLVTIQGGGLTYMADLSGLAMKCTWDGGGAVTGVTGFSSVGTVTANLAGRSCTFALTAASSGAPQGGSYTGTAVLRFALNQAQGGGEPPRNIKIFKAEHEARVVAGEIFDPDWLEDVSQWHILRLMDFMQTNNSLAEDLTHIADDDFRYWGGTSITQGGKTGAPPSAIAALANESGRPIWITIPHLFTDAAITTFAEYLRDNVSPSIMIYVEYTNEHWSDTFDQKDYMEAQGALVSGDPWAADSATTQGRKWYGLRASQVMELFRTAFGTDSGTRWTGVISSQGSTPSVFTSNLVGVDYHIANDVGAADTTAKLFSHVGIAPYVGPVIITTGSGVGATLLGWVNESLSRDDDYEYFNQQFYDVLKYNTASNSYLNIKFWQAAWQTYITAAAARGLTVIWYEGGYGSLCGLPLRDNLSGETEGTKMNLAFCKFAQSEQAARLEASMWNAFLADGGAMVSKFNGYGLHTKYGSWGYKQYRDDPSPMGVNCDNWNAGLINLRLGTP